MSKSHRILQFILSLTYTLQKALSCALLFLGLGGSFVFMACLLTTTMNFSTRHRGKAIGVLEAAMVGIAPTVFSSLYSAVFSNGDYKMPRVQNAQGFLLVLAIGTASAYLLCLLLLRYYKHDDVTLPTLTTSKSTDSVCSTEDDLSVSDGGYTEISNINDPARKTTYGIYTENSKTNDIVPLLATPIFKTSPKSTFWQRLRNKTSFFFSLDFQCIMWAFCFTAGTQPMFNNNIPSILASSNNADYQPLLTTLAPVSAIVSSILATIVSDFLINKCPRTVFVLLYDIIFTLAFILLSVMATNIGVMIFSTIVMGCCTGFVWALMVPTVGEMLGKEHFSRNWGIIIFSCAIMNYLSQFLFSYFYDLHVTHDRMCYGNICTQTTFIIMSFLGFLAVLLTTVLVIKNKKRSK